MKAAFHTLGCKVNQYETEAMKEQFRKAGYEITGEEDPADVYIINTCTVTAVSDKKSRNAIRRAKKRNENAVVGVCGCYAQVAPALAQKGYRVIVPYLRGYGTTRFLSASTPRNGQPSAMAADIVHLMDALNIRQADLAGFDWGARTADIVAALWPQRVKSLVSVSGYLISSQQIGEKPLPPQAELSWWYQFYFATPRGEAGYRQNTHDFAKFIWHQASPQWQFSDATFAKTARALDNPDHVAITISNYRWRLGLEKGEAKYAGYEQRLAALPPITVPTITLEGADNGAPHPAPASYRAKFTGKYEHRDLPGAVGHNPPQEDPTAFVQAVVDADRL